MEIKIEKAKNGYILKESQGTGALKIFYTIQELFDWLLLIFEGKSENFKGDLYGKVEIKIKEIKKI